MEEGVIIRKYHTTDRVAIEDIQLKTFLIGKPLVLSNKKWVTEDILYYLEKEPQRCFVAEYNGKIVGYLLGCLSDANHEAKIFSYIGRIYGKIFLLSFMHKSDRKFWRNMIGFMTDALFGRSGEKNLASPKNAGHIHINLLHEARGKGVGSKLLERFFAYAKSNCVKTIHADSFQTRLNPNTTFWIKNVFKEYSKVKTLFWKAYYPKEDIKLVCYYRKL